ncbi:hypothetical protein ACS0TY_030679 [Phlomoides rotata]
MGSEERKKHKRMKKSNDGKSSREEKSQMITDDRFASAQTDPRFIEPKKRRSKVAIDSRFLGVFTDKSFSSSNAPVDKRGKPKNNKRASATALSHYYSLGQQENGNEASRIGKREDDESLAAGTDQVESEKLNETFEDDDDDDGDVHSLDEPSPTSTTDSDSDSDSDGQYLDEEEEDTFMQQEDNVPEIEDETRRLAIVNLDWSQVRAVDLYVLLSSFLPKGGQVLSVSVYPSEFGAKRMAEEAVRGPVGLFDEEDKTDDGEDDEIDNNKLRSYELSRLRYYYAVVECDSIATADYLYKTCDGVEFERSANKLDLRFIPDSMEFKHQPRDVATEAPADYEGLDFQTRALQHSNIHLTWDDDEPQRAKTLKRKLNDGQIAELELKEFLASDDSESDDSDNEVEDKSARKCKKRDKYRALFESGDGSDEDEDEEGQDMEVTFSTGLEDISKRILEKKNKKSETVWDAYLRKRKEKKKASKKGSKYSSEDESSDADEEPAEEADDFFVEEPENKSNPVRGKKMNKSTMQEREASRAELELLAADDKGEDTNLKGYNIKPKKSKGKKGKSIPDEDKIPTVDFDDPRFAPLFTSSHYALDPTDPQFKRSATYARQITQKKKMSTKRD